MPTDGRNEHSKTPTTIKIAAKDPSKRGSGGQADPGPGDMSAEPSEMPERVSIPAPPTDSELVIKSRQSVDSRAIKTIHDPVSLPKSKGSSASTVLKSIKTLPHEPTSSKTLSGSANAGPMSAGGTMSGSGGATAGFAAKSTNSSKSSDGSAGAPGGPPGAPGPSGRDASIDGSALGAVKTAKSSTNSQGAASGPAASQAMQAPEGSQPSPPSPSGAEQDLIDEGETVVEHPDTSPSPAASPADLHSGSEQPSGGIDTAPASSGGGASKMSPKTSAKKQKSSATGSDAVGGAGSSSGPKKGKKKVTKFRYHKRVTVRTHGKTSPSSIMNKVNKKDHKAGITPSTIEDMDTEELMKRAGIKANDKTHWRVRLRQTKRITKNGKTTTETKVAYRDSEGHKRVNTSSTPYCKKCGKKLEDCKCNE